MGFNSGFKGLISLLEDSRKEINFECMYSSVSIVTRQWEASSGLNSRQGHIFFFSAHGPDRLWVPSTLVLSEKYLALLPRQ